MNLSKELIRKTVDCPKCGAKKGEKCFQKNGVKRREPNHHERLVAAQVLAKGPVPKKLGCASANRKRNRRAKASLSSKDFYGSWEWAEVRYLSLQMHGRRCMCCGWSPTKKSKGHLCVDHIKPRSKYPHLELDVNNTQVLCTLCNRGKSNIYEDDFRDEWHGDNAEPDDPLTAQFKATMQ